MKLLSKDCKKELNVLKKTEETEGTKVLKSNILAQSNLEFKQN